MPHKPKHRQLHRREKKHHVAPPVALPQTLETGASQAVPPTFKATVAKPKTGAPVQSIAAIGAARYPYMTSEIKWIGIFAGIVVVILIILALVLPRFIS